MHKRPNPLGLLVVLSLLVAVPTFAVPAVGVTAANQLVRFDTTTPGTVTTVAITGLTGGETPIGLDYRPFNDQLTLVTTAGRIYRVDPTSGAATLITTITGTTLSGTAFGVDFNPTVDRLRIVSDADQNLRIVPDSGAATTDTALQYATTDVNAAANPNVTASAYTNSFNGASTTTLYGIDTALDILVTQAPPNNGTLNTVGALGVDTGALTGFDIQSNGTSNLAFAALQTGGGTSIYSINLTTGAATLIGAVGGGLTLAGFAVVPGSADIPTLSITMLLLLGAALVAVGFVSFRAA